MGIDLNEFTADKIASRIKARLKNPASKIEGSFAMDSIYAISEELSKLTTMDYTDMLDMYLVDTAEGEYLDAKAKDYFMTRNPATKASGTVVLSGQAETVIPKGTIVIAGDLSYTTDKEVILSLGAEVKVSVTCTTEGSHGNIAIDMIDSISSSSGLSGISVRNDSPFEGGTDEETDDHFRSRIEEKKRNLFTGGNEYSYVVWAKEVSGVGNAICLPCHEGNGTTCIVILSVDGGVPDDTIIQNVDAYIETKRLIGADITIKKAVPKDIILNATVALKSGYRLEEAKEEFMELLSTYLIDKTFGSKKTLSFYKISDLLFNTEAIDDVQDYTLNGERVSVASEAEEFFHIEVNINAE